MKRSLGDTQNVTRYRRALNGQTGAEWDQAVVNSAAEQSLVGTAIQTPSGHLRIRYRPRLILLHTQPCQFAKIMAVKNSVHKEDGLFRRIVLLFWPHSARRPMPRRDGDRRGFSQGRRLARVSSSSAAASASLSWGTATRFSC